MPEKKTSTTIKKDSNTSKKDKNSNASVKIKASYDLKVQFKKTSSILPYNVDSEITGRASPFLEEDIFPKESGAKKVFAKPSAKRSIQRRKPTTCCGKCCAWCWTFESRAKGDQLTYTPGHNCFIWVILVLCALMLAFTLAVVIIASIPLNLPVYGEDVFKETEKFAETDEALYGMIGCAVALMMVSYLYCCSYCSRVIIINALLNIITVCAASYIAAFVAVAVSANIVISVVMTTLIITLFCTILACARFNFTRLLLIVLVFFLTIIIASSLVALLFFVFHIMLPVFSIICVIVASLLSCLAVATMIQVMLKGNSVRLGNGEYAFGSFMLYTALISIFFASMKGMGRI